MNSDLYVDSCAHVWIGGARQVTLGTKDPRSQVSSVRGKLGFELRVVGGKEASANVLEKAACPLRQLPICICLVNHPATSSELIMARRAYAALP